MLRNRDNGIRHPRMTTREPIQLPPRQSDPSKPRALKRVVLASAMVALLGLGAWLLFLRPDGGVKPQPDAGATPTPTASPSPTAVADPQMGDDPVAAFHAIYAKRTRAISERRPELVDEIYRSDCICYELKAIVQRATAAGQHHRGYDPNVLKVIEVTKYDPLRSNLASVRVITEQGPYTIETDDGTVIDRDPGWAPQSTYWSLVKAREGSWRIEFLDIEGTAEEVLGKDWRSTIP
jgi:hypothetical protein